MPQSTIVRANVVALLHVGDAVQIDKGILCPTGILFMIYAE